MTRPRAADDFPRIRARMEELRRERARPVPLTTLRPSWTRYPLGRVDLADGNDL